MAKTALIVGSSGLIGSQLLNLLLEDKYYDKVIAPTRMPLSVQHPHLVNPLLKLDQYSESRDLLKADDVFCCLGTTMKKAKSKTAFLAVDYDAPLTLAQVSFQNGATQYLLVSSLGANSKSSIFYYKVKGDAESSVSKIGFHGLHIFRPSLLLGPRTENRAGEDAAKWVYRIFHFLIPTQYKAIEGAKVARAMLSMAKSNKSGTYIHESFELQNY